MRKVKALNLFVFLEKWQHRFNYLGAGHVVDMFLARGTMTTDGQICHQMI